MVDCVWCADNEDDCQMCRPAPPPEKKLTPAQAAKRARLAAPPARRREVSSPETEAIRAFDAWGMLAPAEKAKHAQILAPRIRPESAEVFRKWRQGREQGR